MTVRQLTTYHTVMANYRIRKSSETENLASILKIDIRNIKIITLISNLTLYRNSFTYRGINEWNLLPERIRESENIGSFKKEVKVWIFKEVSRF